MTTPESKRRWYQFSLKTLLIFVTVFAVCMSWIAVKMRQAAQQIEAVEKAMEADKDNKPSYEAFVAAHAFPYSAPSERKDQITKHYARLRVGLSKKEVADILGDPDRSEQHRSKGPRDEYLGTSWTYYFEKPNPNLVNVIHDKTVYVSFDPTGKVRWVVSNIEGLEEIGKPGR